MTLRGVFNDRIDFLIQKLSEGCVFRRNSLSFDLLSGLPTPVTA